ncbi:hypothetical protein RvY_11425 [Ramazzottius varieornatus]|uniref:RFX-type winged-helix domain-containing protein n=1 Tax=Ramazzottius varieornatus TaxID=947166 RepID=A0A1D1VPX2_RAMVA|nr:hypothetical protein RvY_11425 [Ramazzottius varieornatus]
MADYNGCDPNVALPHGPWGNGAQLHNYSSDSAVFSYGGHLFESLGEPSSYASTDDQLHFGAELEYLDLDTVHGTQQSSALSNNFQIDDSSAGITYLNSWSPVANVGDGVDHVLQGTSSANTTYVEEQSLQLDESCLSNAVDESYASLFGNSIVIGENDMSVESQSSLGISNQDENSLQDRTYGADPLDGLDDFRALLEAAERDENYQNPRGPSSQLQHSHSLPSIQVLASHAQPSTILQSTPHPSSKKFSTKVRDKDENMARDDTAVPAKVRKRASNQLRVATTPNKIKYPMPERRRPKPKEPEPVRFTDDNVVPGLSNEVGLGVVPKYRAKNRLRSIIKRKPGTQDTDLMSNNVEILGGRVDKQTLAWLRENFEEQTGQIMRREFLYERYLEFCQLTGREAMNAACVGKVVRTVFQGLSTRRLGRRGGSKYHYVNLQVVENSPFASLRQTLGNAQKTGRKTKKQKTSSSSWADGFKVSQDDASVVEESSVVNLATAKVWAKNQKKLEAVELDFVTSGLSDEERSRRNIQQLAANCLGEMNEALEDVRVIPPSLADENNWRMSVPFEEIVSEKISVKDLIRFLSFFRIHIGMLSALMTRLNLHCIPGIINNFWKLREPSLQIPPEDDLVKFYAILHSAHVQEFIRRTMTHLLENVYQFLLPAKYASISDHLRAVLRDLASKFDMWMVSATESLPDGARDALISSVFGFCRVIETVLDLSANVENMSLLERQKSSRPPLIAALESLTINGCLMTANIAHEDRAYAQACISKLRALPDGRNMAESWDAWLTESLQQRSDNVELNAPSDTIQPEQLLAWRIHSLDGFSMAWGRLMLELEAAVRFPGCVSSGPSYGIIRFIRDSVAFAVDTEKARLHGKSLIALNAAAVSHSVIALVRNTTSFCDYTLEHYIQCGIPIPLVDSNSVDFFSSVPEVASLIRTDLTAVEAHLTSLHSPRSRKKVSVIINCPTVRQVPATSPPVISIMPVSSVSEDSQEPVEEPLEEQHIPVPESLPAEPELPSLSNRAALRATKRGPRRTVAPRIKL